MENEKGVLRNSPVLRGIIVGLAAALIVLIIFGLGMFVGAQKARFSYRWATYYHRNFGGPRGGFMGPGGAFMRGFGGRGFINGHGVFGEVIKVDKNVVTIKSRQDIEKSIVISDKTTIIKSGQTIKASELKVGDILVVIGSPNDKGQIEAKMIRVFNP